MSEVTRILHRIEAGDKLAPSLLLPLVYDELRSLAKARMAFEKPGQTLQSTALVHEAYIRLVDVENAQQWDSRGHFFAAAAEAMRRILVEHARHKKALKSGGDWQRVDLRDEGISFMAAPDDLLALDEALEKLIADDSVAADVARLRLFTGVSLEEAALALGLSHTTAFRHWTYARAFLQHELRTIE